MIMSETNTTINECIEMMMMEYSGQIEMFG